MDTRYNKMTYSALLLVIFITIIKNEGLEALTEESMEASSGRVIQVRDTFWGSSSSGILKSHYSSSYPTSRVTNLTLSAPKDFSILAAIQMIDLRPNNKDNLTLFIVNGSRSSSTFSNPNSFQWKTYDSSESQTFVALNGQLGISFATGPGSSNGYKGFKLTYTVYSNKYFCRLYEYQCKNRNCIASTLTCDGHNHCGDRSDQSTSVCYKIPEPKTPKNVAGIVCGVIFLLIALGCLLFIIIRRATRSNTESTIVTTHPPPPTYQPPIQPGTYYPPPPPTYSQYPQGNINPSYR